MVQNTLRMFRGPNSLAHTYLFLQAFDPVAVYSLSSSQGLLSLLVGQPQPLGLTLGLLTLPSQALAHTVGLLHLGQLGLVMKHTHKQNALKYTGGLSSTYKLFTVVNQL